MDNLKAEGIKAFFWQFLGKIGQHGIRFIASIFLARLLEPSDFGLIAMVMVIFSLATIFTDVGLGSALVQKKKLHPLHYSSVFYFNISIGSLLTLLTFFSSEWISEFYNNEELLPIIQVMSFMFIITAFTSVQNTLLHKQLKYRLLTKINIVAAFISGIAGVSLAYYGAGVWSLVCQIMLNGIIYNIIIWSITTWVPLFSFSWKALKQLWGFGFRIFISAMLNEIFNQLDSLIIGKLFTPATLGYLQRAKSLNNMVVQYSSGSLVVVLFPVLAKIQNDLPRFQNIVKKSLGIICFVVFFLLGVLYLTAEEIIIILFTDKWLPSVDYFEILVLSGFAYPVSAILVNILKSRGNSKDFLNAEVYKKIIAMLNFVVLYYYGIIYFLYGFVLVSIISVFINIKFAAKEIKIPSYQFVKPIIVQIVLTVAMVYLTMSMTSYIDVSNIMSIFIKSCIFLLLYLMVNYLFRIKSFIYSLEQLEAVPFFEKKIPNTLKKYIEDNR